MALETGDRPRLNRIGLIFLSIWLAILIGLTLYGSWAEPQAQGQISLYQTDLTLEALEWQSSLGDQDQLKTQLFGDEPVEAARTQYQKVRASLLKVHPELQPLPTDAGESHDLDQPAKNFQTRETLDQLNLKLGILEAKNAHVEEASKLWQEVQTAPYSSSQHQTNRQIAEALDSVWRSHSAADAESILNRELSGWFRAQSLQAFYAQTGETEKANQLQETVQTQAESAIVRLSVAVGLPLVGGIAGIFILVSWLVKTLRSSIAPEASSAPELTESSSSLTPLGIEVPWPLETFWLTMMLWFFAFFGVSLMVPLSLQLVFGSAISSSARGQALLALTNYSGLIVAGLALIVYMTRSYLKNFFKWLPLDTNRPWIPWGLGGYIAALPLVLFISLINQKLLGDQGGGNPLLEIILQTHDIGTWFILLFMVAVLAPLFEETVFRGFALTSLSRYLPMWGAIACSAVLFAIAHLNIADFLPLFVLGCILGTVYAQSKNLLASILLHSLWNGAQLVELLYLSGN